jgi:arylsulfatase A-like enzyme
MSSVEMLEGIRQQVSIRFSVGVGMYKTISANLVCSIILVAHAFAACADDSALSERPNVVLILLDNLGQEWFGCYGSEERSTPNIDRLASEGVRFEHCYTFPICGPSRTVLLTGRQPYRTGFTLHHDAALYSGGGLDSTREVIFPRLFHDAGYHTGIAGKWQINNLYDEPDVLTRHGFDEHLVWPGSIDADRVTPDEIAKFRDAVRRESVPDTSIFLPMIESRYWNPVFLCNGKREVHPGRFGPDVTQEFAIDFLKRHRDRPFMFYYPMHLAHGQSFKEPVVHTPLAPDSNRPHHEMYANMVRYADKLIGELVLMLDELKLRDNTLVFIASDNGTENSVSARRNGRVVKGGLYSLTEAGGSVALIANSPKHFPGGRTVTIADFTDIFTTLCDLAGIPLPNELIVDGKSFAATLRGDPKAKPHRDWIFNQLDTMRVVRDERFKLYSDGRFFDANADPDEQHELGDTAQPEAVAARDKLQRALASLPADSPPPFPLRSQAVFKLRAETSNASK